MIRRTPGAFLMLGTLVACTEPEDRAGQGPQLLVPDDVEVHWDASFNQERDGLGALVPVDVMVYEAASGEPLGEVMVELESHDPGTWLLVDEDFEVVAPEGCADCPFVWDARRDQYFVLRVTDPRTAEEADTPAAWAEAEVLEDLHRIMLETDAGGLARVYLFVDSFPWDDEVDDFGPVSVLVSLGQPDAQAVGVRAYFDLVPR